MKEARKSVESKNHLILQPISSTFIMATCSTETVLAWRSKRLSGESIRLPTTPGISLFPKLKWIHNSKI